MRPRTPTGETMTRFVSIVSALTIACSACGGPLDRACTLSTAEPIEFFGSEAHLCAPSASDANAPSPVGFLTRSLFELRGYCAATLLGPDLVITAAHCATELDAFFCRSAWEEQCVAVTSFRAAPGYDGMSCLAQHDLAIARLAVPQPAPYATLFEGSAGAERFDLVHFTTEGTRVCAPGFHEDPRGGTLGRANLYMHPPESADLDRCAHAAYTERSFVWAGDSGAPLLTHEPSAPHQPRTFVIRGLLVGGNVHPRRLDPAGASRLGTTVFVFAPVADEPFLREALDPHTARAIDER